MTEQGAGSVKGRADQIQLSLPPASAAVYHNAQISDYDADARNFSNKAPLRLQVSARAQGPISGTAGFGFWNHAFLPGKRAFHLPQAIWFFFASPPNNIALAKGLPGNGWKAATIDTANPRFYAMLPLAPLGFLLMRYKPFYNALWSLGQGTIKVNEALLDPALLDDFHNYRIDWLPDSAIFAVDDTVVLQAKQPASTPLGFIAWIDNQYAIVTPQGQFGRGLLNIPQTQSLTLRELQITSLA